MEDKRSIPRPATSAVMPLTAGAIAVGIFVVDTGTPLDVAVAVLYVVVILIAASTQHRRGVLLVSAGCLGLTVLSFLLTHGLSAGPPLMRCIMSVSAIAITTFLALKNQAATMVLREQASLLDLSHDAIFVRDLNDTVTFWNQGAERLYGWPKEQVLGKASHQLLRTVFPVSYEECMADLLRAGRWESELVHTKRDGTQVTTASRWALQRDDRQRPVAVLETNTDITESKRAHEALLESQAELAHVTRITTLGELTASIAHEVNQPLAAIVTNGEACLRWIARDVPQIDEARSAVQRMIGDGRRASEVIARIRGLSRKAARQMAPLSLNDVVEEVIPLLERELHSHRAVLSLDLAPDLPPVVGDRIQLQQVTINLLINAIQAMANVADRPRVLLVRSRLGEDGRALVAVQDSGTGIAPAHAERLFSPFFTTKPNGMGMGLSICRSIVEAHGGRVWAEPNAGPGTTFQFALPAAGKAA